MTMPRWSTLLLVLCISVGFAVLCGLGTWQLQRLAWKEALIERVNAGLSADPVSVDDIAAMEESGEDIEYRPAFASGRFDHSREQHYFATHKGRSGYFVYTPLIREDNSALFVNRGFVPMHLKDAEKRSEGQIEGVVRIEGLARSAPHEKPNSFVPNNDLGKNVYYWKSLAQMSGRAFDKMETSIVPVFLDANDKANPGGWPLGGVTRITFPNSHLQYAITWFGLALALLGVGGFFLRSRRRPSAY